MKPCRWYKAEQDSSPLAHRDAGVFGAATEVDACLHFWGLIVRANRSPQSRPLTVAQDSCLDSVQLLVAVTKTNLTQFTRRADSVAPYNTLKRGDWVTAYVPAVTNLCAFVPL